MTTPPTPMLSDEDIAEWSPFGQDAVARLWLHRASANIAFVSASLPTLSIRENRLRTQSAKHEIRQSGFGYLRVTGHYTKPPGAFETSFMLIAGESDLGQLRAFTIKLGARWDQESILLRPAGANEVLLIGASRTGWRGVRRVTSLGSFEPSRLGEFYGALRGRAFVIDGFFRAKNLMARYGHRQTLSEARC